MLGTPEHAAAGRIVRWLQLVPLVGEGEDARRELVPMPCMQCENPPCTKVCPTSATYVNPEGIVGQVYPRCIGCRYCVNACPYTCKHFNWMDPKWPGKMGDAINPDVSVRYKGVTEKCLFCHHRLQRARERASAEGRELRNGEYTPACVAACPADAIAFGDINDPESKVSRQFASARVFRILEELGTEPKVVYLRKV